MQTKNTFALAVRHIVLAASIVACVVAASSALASPLDWVAGDRVQGSGTIKKQARELAHFTGVSLSLPATMELRIGNSENITIETDDNLLPLIETAIENGVLKIRPLKRNANLQARSMKIVVNAKSVERLSLGGSGSIDSDALRGGKLQFDLGGSGSIRLKGMEGDSVAISVGGSGNLKSGAGKAGSVSVSIGGSGDVDVGQVQVKDASVSVAGSGTAVVWASGALSATIAGSGDVNYYGDPKVSHTVIGSGGTRRLGGAPR
ncbi:MAG: head GIN domain-containing protein [Pseudomonadota bacterium]